MYCVYILASRTKVLYIGVTGDMVRRMHQHRLGTAAGFTAKYSVNRLVRVETCSDPVDAIRREKQLKGWVRKRKIALIEEENPDWKDLAAGWFEKPVDPSLRSG